MQFTIELDEPNRKLRLVRLTLKRDVNCQEIFAHAKKISHAKSFFKHSQISSALIFYRITESSTLELVGKSAPFHHEISMIFCIFGDIQRNLLMIGTIY